MARWVKEAHIWKKRNVMDSRMRKIALEQRVKQPFSHQTCRRDIRDHQTHRYMLEMFQKEQGLYHDKHNNVSKCTRVFVTEWNGDRSSGFSLWNKRQAQTVANVFFLSVMIRSNFSRDLLNKISDRGQYISLSFYSKFYENWWMSPSCR